MSCSLFFFTFYAPAFVLLHLTLETIYYYLLFIEQYTVFLICNLLWIQSVNNYIDRCVGQRLEKIFKKRKKMEIPHSIKNLLLSAKFQSYDLRPYDLFLCF